MDNDHGSSTVMTIHNYNDMDELQSALSKTGQGMLAFVISEQSLLLRVTDGWQYISVNYNCLQRQRKNDKIIPFEAWTCDQTE